MTHIVAARVETQDRADLARSALQRLGYGGDDVEVFYVTPPGEHGQYPIGGDRDADPLLPQSSQAAVAGAAMGAAAGVVAGTVAAAAAPLVTPAIVAGVTGVGALAGAIGGALRKAGDHKSEELQAENSEAATQRAASNDASLDQALTPLDGTTIRASHSSQTAASHTAASHTSTASSHADSHSVPSGAEPQGIRRGGLMVAVNVGTPDSDSAVVDCLRAIGAEAIEHADGQWREGHWIDFDPLRQPRFIDDEAAAQKSTTQRDSEFRLNPQQYPESIDS